MGRPRLDIIGKRFKKLVVLKMGGLTEQRGTTFICQCDCGNKVKVRGVNLINGDTKSCGCLRSDRQPNFKDLSGTKTGKLTIISFNRIENHKSYWNCVCECGNPKIIKAIDIGKIQSCGCLKRLEFGEGAFNVLYRSYKAGAKSRKLEWNLSKEEFKHITKMNCYYCGANPSGNIVVKTGYGNYVYNGIDRIDNNKGYTIDNCVPCCKICNIAKHDYSINNFREWVISIYSHWILK